jgi:glycosyltransferase involved in cell wall biosynthesis
VIVVDDGSTDGTRRILQPYQKKIRILHQQNRGVSSARNRGIAAASGRLIAFLDSDDLWLPGKLSTQVNYFEKKPGTLICQTEEIWIRNRHRINPKRRHKKPSGMIFEPSLHLCLVSPSAVVVKKCLFDLVGTFDEALPACEDYDLWLRVGCRHPIYLIDKPLVVKRGGHPGQLSASPGLDKFRIRSLVKLLESGRLNPAQYTAAAGVLKKKCAIYSSGCRKRGRTEEAGHYLQLGEKYG